MAKSSEKAVQGPAFYLNSNWEMYPAVFCSHLSDLLTIPIKEQDREIITRVWRKNIEGVKFVLGSIGRFF